METYIINRITDVMGKNNFSGTVLVKNDNKILAEKSYGYSNRSEQIENSFDTRFGIASGFKIIYIDSNLPACGGWNTFF